MTVRVAICTADVGAGHSRAAAAVTNALRERRPEWSFHSVDALEHAPRLFTRFYRDGYLAMVKNVPRIVGAMYRMSDKRRTRSLKYSLGCKAESLALTKFLNDPRVVDADLIVCTHFLCARVLSAMRSRSLLRGKLAVVITDQHPHAVWRIPNADLYLVASHSAVDVLEAAGIERTRTLVSGIPIDGVFGHKLTPSDARARHGLEQHVPLALITGGGLGLGGLDRALDGYLKGTRAGHAVVVCGSNAGLRAELETMMGQHPARERVTILGMTSQMHELMAAADVMVGKPGGLTTSEALARGLPMVLLRPIPGQEECNATKLVEAGAAVLVQDSFEAGKRAAMLISEIGLLQEMKGAAVAIGRPNATEYAARAIVRIAMKAREAEVATSEAVLVAG